MNVEKVRLANRVAIELFFKLCEVGKQAVLFVEVGLFGKILLECFLLAEHVTDFALL